ncbi:hypothetical protein RJ639_003739 [Escallonia herrerae]|uniref:Myb-like domain-containing protein n=1 Tax=Escallonia herrerae TaxID=1293975 RepID=A0AA88W390_9ASTE|nr:hypothetical protein RJ639_003739 [Escallonia herrerae]
MTADETSDGSVWSREQDIAFENALATYPEDSADRWEKISADVPGKSLEDIKHHYELLVDDVNRIDAGRVPLPSYSSTSDGSGDHAGEEVTGKKGGGFGHFSNESNHVGKASRSDQERRKGVAWTEDEHRFLFQVILNYNLFAVILLGQPYAQGTARRYTVTCFSAASGRVEGNCG